MITVLYTTLAKDIATSALIYEARERFSHPDCASYIDTIASKKSAVGARESLAALVLLARAAERMGVDTSTLSLARTHNGKPYFQGSKLCFSITHSKGYVAVALSDRGEVGIDLETASYDEKREKKLAERYFKGDEKTEFGASAESFARIWTKKEAYVKLCGITLAQLLSSSDAGDEHSSLAANEVFYRFFKVDGHPLTLCTYKKDEQVLFIKERLQENAFSSNISKKI